MERESGARISTISYFRICSSRFRRREWINSGPEHTNSARFDELPLALSGKFILIPTARKKRLRNHQYLQVGTLLSSSSLVENRCLRDQISMTRDFASTSLLRVRIILIHSVLPVTIMSKIIAKTIDPDKGREGDA